MNFLKTSIEGVIIIEPDKHEDERGFFGRSYCEREFRYAGLKPCCLQCNISYNKYKGTVRGMHFQTDPHPEAKLIRCIRGSIYDVVVDLRSNLPSYCRSLGFELSAREPRLLYVPEGMAHGFQTLEDDSEVFYQMSEFYFPDSASGLRWNDPSISISWPLPISQISQKDLSYPDFRR